jgi:DNA-directed RNA polymerase specialized sigma24 family protein
VLKQKTLKQKDIYTDIIFEKDKEKLKKSFHAASEDQKAIISYGFNRGTNELKLTPLGFWQLQFLSRIFQQKPKSQDDLEAIFFHSKAFGEYYNKAERTLSDFYMHAIYPMAVTLTGRSYAINPNDHEFQIMLQNSWDKVKDNINKYDASIENFGAWTFTVARNALIDQIKKITDYDFQDTAEARDFIINQNLVYLHFTKDMNKKIPEEFLVQLNPEDKQDVLELERQKENLTHLYKFKTADDLFDFLQENQTNQSVFKSLSSISRRILNNLKVLHSRKKFANVWAQDSNEETYDIYQTKAEGEERDKNLIELYNLYKKNTDMSIDKKSFQETKNYESILNEDGERIYPDDELEMAFKRDIGMALFYYQTEFIKNFPHLDTKIPGEVIDAVLTKYVSTLPDITDVQKNYKSDAYHYVNKTLREKSKGDVVANPILFKNKSINNSIIEEIDPYIRYDYKVARAMKKEDIIPALREEFIKRQEDGKHKEDEIAKSKNMYPKPVYTFRDRIDEMFAQIGKGVSGLMNIKREKGDANIVKKIELLDRFSTALSRLTGVNIQLEESKNNSIDEINNYLLKMKKNIIKKNLI